jgi:molybdopterin converting factor small subunit
MVHLTPILRQQGEPRPFVNICVGSADVRTLRGLDTPVSKGDILSILPAVAGGGGAR